MRRHWRSNLLIDATILFGIFAGVAYLNNTVPVWVIALAVLLIAVSLPLAVRNFIHVRAGR